MGGPGGDVDALNAERRAVREDPTVVHERLQRSLVLYQLTELRDPPLTLAAAWRIAAIDPDCSAATAQRRAVGLKTWARRYLGGSLAASMIAFGMDRESFLGHLDNLLHAAKRDGNGRIRKDPDTDAPIPDTATRFRALAIVERLLHVSGQFGLARSDAIAREDATERAEREISADAQRLIEERADGTAAQFDADADALAAGDLEV